MNGAAYPLTVKAVFPKADPLPKDLLTDFTEKTASYREQLDATPVAGAILQ